VSIFLYLLFIIPIGACVAILAGAPARLTSLAATAVNVGICAILVLAFDPHAPTNVEPFQFAAAIDLLKEPHLALSVGVDGMSVILLILATLVTLCAVWVIPSKVTGSEKLYYICTLLIAAGAIGAFVSTDLFFFYAFHELALIPTFLMIALVLIATTLMRIR
jgi:NADH-quinone oxidoreductase subunit M